MSPPDGKIVLFIILILQLAFVTAYLPLGEWFSDSLIYSDDFIVHYGATLIQNQIMDKQGYGVIWGYLPFFRAGSVTMTLLSIDSKAWGIFARLSSSLISYEAGFKLFLILCILSIPVALYYASKNFGLNEKTSLIACTAGTVYLQISICVDFIKWGTISFVCASYLSILAVSFFYSYLESGRFKKLIYFTVICIITFWIHILAAIAVALPLVSLIILRIHTIPPIRLCLAFVSSAVVLLMTYPIYYPLIYFYDLRTSFFPWDPYFTSSKWEPVKTYVFQSSIFNGYAGIPFKKSTLFDLVLLIFALYGFYRLIRNRRTNLFICLAGAFAGFFLLGFYGSFREFTKRLTPLRFLITMNAFLCIAAAEGFSSFMDKRKGNISRNILWATAIVLLVFFLWTPYYHFYALKDLRLATSEPQGAKELIEMIKTNTSAEGRILCENSDWESGHQFFGGHFAVLLPHYTGREFLGSEYSTDPMKDSFVSFYGGFLFHKELNWYNEERLKDYFNIYNIKWILCWSPEALRLMESFPDYIQKKAQSGVFRLYEVNRAGTYFLKGTGKISTSINNLKLSGIKPDSGEIIISYHWIKALKTNPYVEIIAINYLDDPVGLIKLINPPADVTVYNGY